MYCMERPFPRQLNVHLGVRMSSSETPGPPARRFRPLYVQLTCHLVYAKMLAMTTTVTTTTIASVTTLGLGATIALVVVLLLIGFLISKEILTFTPDDRTQSAGRVFSVGVFPLLIAFGAIILTKLILMFSPLA